MRLREHHQGNTAELVAPAHRRHRQSHCLLSVSTDPGCGRARLRQAHRDRLVSCRLRDWLQANRLVGQSPQNPPSPSRQTGRRARGREPARRARTHRGLRDGRDGAKRKRV